MDLDLSRQDFVNGVDLLEGVDAVGGGFDVDDGVHEGGVLGEAGGWGQDGNTGSKEREREKREKNPCWVFFWGSLVTTLSCNSMKGSSIKKGDMM